MSRIYDILIIGGGIVGLGVFNRLTLNGYRNVLLVEKASQIITGASSGNSGILHTGFDAIPGTLESKLVQRGYELYHAFARDLPLPIKRIGALMIAWENHELEILQQILHNAHQNGVFDIEEISTDFLDKHEPNLRANAQSALYIPGESIVDPLTLPLILYMQSKLFGGHVQMNTEIINGKYDHDRQYWSLNDDTLKAKLVINCAGLFGDHVERIRLADKGNSSTLPFHIEPRIGQFAVFGSSSLAPPIQSILLPIPTKFTKGIIVYPNLFDQIIVGPTAQTQEDRIHAPIESNINDLLHRRIIEFIPQFSSSDFKHIGSYTGIRPATEYSDYQIQCYENVQWICCGGIRSTGLTSSLAIGEYICDQLKTMSHLNDQLTCQGYCSKEYDRSIEELKSIFILTDHGLQAKIVEQKSIVNLPITGAFAMGDQVETASLQIDCAGELIAISHSLLKLAWLTKYPASS